jgi:hypothetical protein
VNDDEPRARSAYSVSLEPVAGAKAWSLAWVKGLIMATASLIGWSEQPAIGDLVVRRTTDDSEAIRTSAGDQEEAALLLEHVQRQIDELSVAEFEEAWGLDAESVDT